MQSLLEPLIKQSTLDNPIDKDTNGFADTKGGSGKGYAYYVNLINNNPEPYGGSSDSAKSFTNYMTLF